nr:MAG: replication associated protein [Cressdnaviricota sp.]
MSKSRNWVFTINNPEAIIPDETWGNIKFLVAGLEIGEGGTQHYQGYLELKTARALSTLKLIFPTAHFEIRRGTRIQAIRYCLKDHTSDDGLLRGEHIPLSLARTLTLRGVVVYGFEGDPQDLLKDDETKKVNKMLEEVQKLLDDGTPEVDIATDYFGVWIKYNQGFKRYKLLKANKRDYKTNVIVVQGPTGTGKSRWAMEQYPDAYWKCNGMWWDGYETQESVIIDEFYGWLPWNLLLRLCDRYPMQVEVKGGAVNFVAKTIVIISNKRADAWYPNQYFDALARRVDEWRVVRNNSTTVYTDVKEVEWDY